VRHPRRTAVAATAVTAAVAMAGCAGPAPPHRAAAGHAAVTAQPAAPAAIPPGPHPGVRLNVLVVSDGSVAVAAIRQELVSEGVPVTVVSLRSGSRPRITSSFLAATLPGGGRAGNFAGVVLPSPAPRGLSPAEITALARYERAFGVRQVDAFTAPAAAVGLHPPVYSGSLQGARAHLTPAARAGGFGYLRGSFTFGKTTTGPAPYGYVATPLPATGSAGYTPLLTIRLPSGRSGAVAGVYASGSRQQLVLGLGTYYYQMQFRYLAPGIVNWLTRGVHLGYWRNYLTIDYDDMFNADARWSPRGHCTPGDSICPPGTPPTKPIRMTPADVAYAVAWQRRHHFTIEFLYNGGSAARFGAGGTDPLLAAVRPVARDFWWVNHTYSHANLGCEPDYSVNPWRCRRDSAGHLLWVSTALIDSQIRQNLTWARRNGIPADPRELATGEYSGLRILPQQPVDNPHLLTAIASNHIRWVAMDASREPAMRHVGAALGVPRYPVNVGYNVSGVANEVSEYNWYYTAKADGGSGMCQHLRDTACIAPLSPRTGWASYILPIQVANVLSKVLQNDPRPFFMHQSNLTGDRLGYQVMDGVLTAYRSVYAPSAPVVNQPFWKAGAALWAQAQWARTRAAGTVTAWVQGTRLIIAGPRGTRVPVTAPDGTGPAGGPPLGSPYAGQRSGYLTLGAHPLTLTLPVAPFHPGPAGTGSGT
jgi:hypothetical protein